MQNTGPYGLLQGEAHFTVAKNPDRPFSRVRRQEPGPGSGYGLLRVPEGRFGPTWTVTEGSVRAGFDRYQRRRRSVSRIHTPSPSATTATTTCATKKPEAPSMPDRARPSTMRRRIRETPGPSTSSRTAGDISRRLAWREGVLMFSGEPLDFRRGRDQSLHDGIHRAGRRGRPRDPDRRPFSRSARTDAMLETLEASFGLRITRLSHDRVLVSAAR